LTYTSIFEKKHFFFGISKIFIILFKAIIKIRKTGTSRPIRTVQKEEENVPFHRKRKGDVMANQKGIALPFS
jgi:hypothetical protein